MAKKNVRTGDTIPVSVELEFEGTIFNHMINVENQFIPTTNNQADDVDVKLDGDPITIIGRFRGEPQSEVKKFEVTINGKTAKHNGLIIKTGEMEIKRVLPYKFFDLKEVRTPRKRARHA